MMCTLHKGPTWNLNSSNPQVTWQLAIYAHGLDQLGLDSEGLQKFSDDSFHTDNRALGVVAVMALLGLGSNKGSRGASPKIGVWVV
jgi:hypothetical protein